MVHRRLLVADFVGVTFGPKGRNLLLHNNYCPMTIVNDGKTVFKEVTGMRDRAKSVPFSLESREPLGLAEANNRDPRMNYKPILRLQESIFSSSQKFVPMKQPYLWWGFRTLSHGSVNLVISEGKIKFETHEVDPPKKEKWLTKKRLKLQRKKEKEKRRAANKTDPRRLGIKGKKKGKFSTAEERIKYKLEKARIKEANLVERLKKYEVPKAQGPVVKVEALTGEERFYMKKMAQKRSNYVPIGRRGIFGGVVLNMHMHWKRHETVKVICKPCKPGQVQEYAQEIARLSGGIPIQVIGDDTIIFYRGKKYVQPEVMSPVDTLSKKKALEKSKYQQSLESVRQFITVSEKELELYYKHISLYGDPNSRNPTSTLDGPIENSRESKQMLVQETSDSIGNGFSISVSETEENSSNEEISETEDDFECEGSSTSEPDSENDSDYDNEDKSRTHECLKVEGILTLK